MQFTTYNIQTTKYKYWSWSHLKWFIPLLFRKLEFQSLKVVLKILPRSESTVDFYFNVKMYFMIYDLKISKTEGNKICLSIFRFRPDFILCQGKLEKFIHWFTKQIISLYFIMQMLMKRTVK